MYIISYIYMQIHFQTYPKLAPWLPWLPVHWSCLWDQNSSEINEVHKTHPVDRTWKFTRTRFVELLESTFQRIGVDRVGTSHHSCARSTSEQDPKDELSRWFLLQVIVMRLLFRNILQQCLGTLCHSLTVVRNIIFQPFSKFVEYLLWSCWMRTQVVCWIKAQGVKWWSLDSSLLCHAWLI